MRRRWQVVPFDPYGQALNTPPMRFWTRRGAQRAWDWLSARPSYVPINGEMVRLVTYKIRRVPPKSE